MDRWMRLDLRCKEQSPKNGELVAMRLIPNNARATFYRIDKYDIGHFEQDEHGRKLWWHGTYGTHSPSGLKKHYDIWWCYVTPFQS
jgi:hypothetical protein